MDEQIVRERIRSLEEHTDKLVAQSDALKAQLTITLAERDAEIAALRQQVAELQAWKDAVPVKAILWYFDVSEFSQAIVNTNTVMQIDYNTALDKWHRDMVEEVIDV